VACALVTLLLSAGLPAGQKEKQHDTTHDHAMLLVGGLTGSKQDCMLHDQVAAVSTVGLVLLLHAAAAVCCAECCRGINTASLMDLHVLKVCNLDNRCMNQPQAAAKMGQVKIQSPYLPGPRAQTCSDFTSVQPI
jgi:hypothetical protein